jgi:hypothetical protein
LNEIKHKIPSSKKFNWTWAFDTFLASAVRAGDYHVTLHSAMMGTKFFSNQSSKGYVLLDAASDLYGLAAKFPLTGSTQFPRTGAT